MKRYSDIWFINNNIATDTVSGSTHLQPSAPEEKLRLRLRSLSVCVGQQVSAQFRVDLERAMAPLPEVGRETALFWFSSVDATGIIWCARQMISRRLHRTRDAFVAAGIRSNHFAGRSTQP